MRAVLYAAILAVSISPLHAQEAPDEIPPRASHPFLNVATATYASAMVTDWVTARLWAQGLACCESNPVARPFVNTHNPALIVAGAALDTAGMLAWRHVVGKHHPTVAAVGLAIGTLIRFHFAANNLAAWRAQGGCHASAPARFDSGRVVPTCTTADGTVYNFFSKSF